MNQLNAALRDVRKERGELGAGSRARDRARPPRLSPPATASSSPATDKKPGIVNGAAGTIEAIDGTPHHRQARRPQPARRSISTRANFDQFRHGYAGTIYRGQGRTLDQTYLYHSEHWRSAASYVALDPAPRQGRAVRRPQHGAPTSTSSPGKWRAPTTAAPPRCSITSRRSARFGR